MSDLSPDDIANRCVAMGARVVTHKDKIAIYPPDRALRPVFISRRFGATPVDRRNALVNLKKVGLDLTANGATVPTPANMPASLPTNAALQQQIAELKSAHETTLGMLAEIEARLGATEAANDHATKVQEEHGSAIYRMARRIEALEARPTAGPTPKPKSKAEVARDLVRAYFEAHRGQKLTPEIVRMNIEDDLPPGTPGTQVPVACKQLAEAGVLKGGGRNNSKPGPGGSVRGVYWMEQEPADDAPATA